MNILVINSGSSSIKYRLIHMDTRSTICSGLIERIGEPTDGRAVHKTMPGTEQAAEITRTQRFPDHKAGFKLMVELLAETKPAGHSGGTSVNAIGHRIVQGGDRFKEACLVTPKTVEEIRDLSPLAGIMMGSRCGDVDPSAVTFVAKQRNIPPEKLDAIMNKQSGLLGICGRNDMRDVHEARAAGDEMAQLAFDMFIYRIQKYLGSYYAILGRVDALVFTAGIGENDDLTRAAACQGLEHLGFKLDAAANAARSQNTRLISTPDSPTAIYVVPTDEELEIAQLTQNLVFSG